MTTQGMIKALENVVEKYKDKPVYTGEIDIPLMCRDVINKLEELSCPWHTGTPTEDGLYLVLLDGHYHKDTTAYIVALWSNNGWRMTTLGSSYNLENKVIAWQKIEPYKEANT